MKSAIEDLEEDKVLFQLFNLADKHNWTLDQVLDMPEMQYWGWIAYHSINGDLVEPEGERKDGK